MHALIRRSFSSTSSRLGRAVVYAANGEPSNVLSVLTYPTIPPPPPNSLNIRFLLSPIHPADINVIEGVYPNKPTQADALIPTGQSREGSAVFVPGKEDLARVTAVGEGVHSFQVNDWVVVIKQQAGTWRTDSNVTAGDVVKVPEAESLTEAQAATITVRFVRFLNSGTNGCNPDSDKPANSIQYAPRFR
jgi:mitochondrial enoyl-[acyl-carrier protein] reductase / trans-2-enoyl-CoA reductase